MDQNPSTKADLQYPYFDYEIRVINDARNIASNFQICNSALYKFEGENLISCWKDSSTMIVQLESFWLREGIEHFSKLFQPLLEEIRDNFLGTENFKRVKFVFPYRLKEIWHWNAAELIFSYIENSTWNVSGAKYDPNGTKSELEEEIITRAKENFYQEILNNSGEIISIQTKKITFTSGQNGGVGCGIYAAFMLHKLKTQDFTTKEELENIWDGIAETEIQQRELDLILGEEHCSEKMNKFGKISEENFVDSAEYLPSDILERYQTINLPTQLQHYLDNIITICRRIDANYLDSLFNGNYPQIHSNILNNLDNARKDNTPLRNDLEQIACYLELFLNESQNKGLAEAADYLQFCARKISCTKKTRQSSSEQMDQRKNQNILALTIIENDEKLKENFKKLSHPLSNSQNSAEDNLFYNYDDSSDEEETTDYANIDTIVSPRINQCRSELEGIKQRRKITSDDELLYRLEEDEKEIQEKIKNLKDWESKNPNFLMETEGRKTIYDRSKSYQDRKKQAFGKTEFPIVSAYEYNKMLAIALRNCDLITEEECNEWQQNTILEQEFKNLKLSYINLDFAIVNSRSVEVFTEENKITFLRKILRQSNRERLDPELTEKIIEFARSANAKIPDKEREALVKERVGKINQEQKNLKKFLDLVCDPKEKADKALKTERNITRKGIEQRNKDNAIKIAESELNVSTDIEKTIVKNITAIAREFKSQLPKVKRKLLSRTRIHREIKSVDDFYTEERLMYRDLIRRSREIEGDKFEIGQSLVFDTEQDLVSQKTQSVRRDKGISAKNFFPYRGTMEEEVLNLGNYRAVLKKLKSINLTDSDLALLIRRVFTNGSDILSTSVVENEEVRMALSQFLSFEQKQTIIDTVRLLFGTEGFRSPATIAESNMLLDLIINDPQNWDFKKAFIGRYAKNDLLLDDEEKTKKAEETLKKKDEKIKNLQAKLSDQNPDNKKEINVYDINEIKDFEPDNQIAYINFKSAKKYYQAKLNKTNIRTLKSMSDEQSEAEKQKKEQQENDKKARKAKIAAIEEVLTSENLDGKEEIDVNEYLESDFDEQTQVISVSIDGIKKYLNGDIKKHIKNLKDLSDLENGGALSYSMKSSVGSGGIACGRHLSQIFDEVVEGGDLENFTNPNADKPSLNKSSSPLNNRLRSHKYGGSFAVNPNDFQEYSNRKAEISQSWKDKIEPDSQSLKEAIKNASNRWYSGI